MAVYLKVSDAPKARLELLIRYKDSALPGESYATWLYQCFNVQLFIDTLRGEYYVFPSPLALTDFVLKWE